MNDYTKGWIRSSSWDSFWLLSGIWLTFLFLMLDSAHLQEMFYATGVFLFWISHRFSSFYLAWGTRAYKPLRRAMKKRFVFFPIFITLGVLAVLYIPESVLAFTFSERIFGLLMIDFAWGAHHFAAQHYGILRLYQYLQKEKSTPSTKKNDRIFCWGVGGVLIIIAELLHGTSFLQEKHVLPNLLSDLGIEGIPLLMRFGTLLVVGSTLFMVRNAWLENYSLPKILYLFGIGLMAVAAFQLDPFQFLMLWTLQHWLAALGLATHMGGNDLKHDEKHKNVFLKKYSDKKFWNPWPVLICLCAFSVAMTPFFEIEAVSAGALYSEQVFPALMKWLQNSELYTFLVGIGLATGFLHYWLDRAVYRFSDLQTRKSALQLLFTSKI